MELWEILVPTQTNAGVPIRTRFHRVWDKRVYQIAGGITIHSPSKGKWVSPTGGLFQERMIPVRIACTREQIERERRYILSRYPLAPADLGLSITQLYMSDKSRLRESTELWPKPGIVSHERIIKEFIEEGAASETDVDGASREEVDLAIRDGRRGLHKLRLVYYSGLGGHSLKWEVDIFSDPIRMVMMEVEVPDGGVVNMGTVDGLMPEFLRYIVLKDVTGVREFSNASMAHTLGNLRPPVTVRPEWIGR